MSTYHIECVFQEYKEEQTVENLGRVVSAITDALDELDRKKLDDSDHQSCGCCW